MEKSVGFTGSSLHFRYDILIALFQLHPDVRKDIGRPSEVIPSYPIIEAKRSGDSKNYSRRFIGAWKYVCCTTAFFLLPSSGRMLFNIQFNTSREILTFNTNIISTVGKCDCIAICSGCFNPNKYSVSEKLS